MPCSDAQPKTMRGHVYLLQWLALIGQRTRIYHQIAILRCWYLLEFPLRWRRWCRASARMRESFVPVEEDMCRHWKQAEKMIFPTPPHFLKTLTRFKQNLQPNWTAFSCVWITAHKTFLAKREKQIFYFSVTGILCFTSISNTNLSMGRCSLSTTTKATFSTFPISSWARILFNSCRR